MGWLKKHIKTLPAMNNSDDLHLFLLDTIEDDVTGHRKAAYFTRQFMARPACLWILKKRPDGFL